jgi:transposase
LRPERRRRWDRRRKNRTTRQGLAQVFGPRKRCRIALEVGAHSPWVSRFLSHLGHEAIVANARQVKLISQSTRKQHAQE